MEVIVILVLLIALGILASRYGYDSRERLRSEEERLADAGVGWGEPPTAQQPGRAKARRWGRRAAALARHGL